MDDQQCVIFAYRYIFLSMFTYQLMLIGKFEVRKRNNDKLQKQVQPLSMHVFSKQYTYFLVVSIQMGEENG